MYVTTRKSREKFGLLLLFYSRSEGIVQRLLGEVKVTEQTDEGGEDPARLGAVDGAQDFKSVSGNVSVIGGA